MTAHEPPVAWPYLAAGAGLIGVSVIGFVPVLLLLGQPGFGEPRAERGGSWKDIELSDGSRLHTEIYGPPSKPTLVFTHGWSLDSTAWYYAKQELSRRFRVVVWDLAGLGRSRGPRTGNYSLDKMADDLATVVQQCSPGPVVLVGHSIGGMIIQTFCRLYAQRLRTKVKGLVLLQTTYTNPLHTALGARFWKAIQWPLLVPLNYLSIWLAPIAWLSNWQSYLNGTLHFCVRVASFSGRQTWGQLNYAALLAVKAWPAVVARGNLAMMQFDEQLTLPHVEIPVLVIAGQYDRMTRPAASDKIESLLSHAMPFSLAAGHLGLWEGHSELADVIAEFATRVAGDDTPHPTRAVGRDRTAEDLELPATELPASGERRKQRS
jgi:pimeloyl-ACP methyl ester carboxylesterase